MTLLLSSVRLAPTLHRVHRLQDKQIFEIYVAVALDGSVEEVLRCRKCRKQRKNVDLFEIYSSSGILNVFHEN